jgi:hypothetical protein
VLTLLKKTDPRILLFAAITLIAVTFSIFKAVGSLSGEADSPGYRNQPPQAFARPLPERIVDTEFLGQDGSRLSDRGYQFAYRSSREISQKFIDNQISSAYLQSWGLPAGAAERQARFLQGQYQGRFAGRETKLSGPPELIIGAVDSAEAQQIVRYGPSKLDPQPGETLLRYQIVRRPGSNSGWGLAEVTIVSQ